VAILSSISLEAILYMLSDGDPSKLGYSHIKPITVPEGDKPGLIKR
jgi:hypothetical protein